MSETPVIWITGGGSGMGRASAVEAAKAGWRVAVSGRRAEAVEATCAAVREAGGEALAVPVDVTDAAALRDAHATIVEEWAPVTGLVLAAGLNAPRRAWADQSADEFAAIVDTNLTSVARVIDLVLPGMREARAGNIVVVSSRSAWRFSPGAGVAYMSSKSALGMLVASLNDQENRNGVKACHLCPGDVDTEFLGLRPNVPDATQRASMLSASDIARSVRFVLDSPHHVRIDELVITPLGQN
ncbi:SDR family NAD(P)-dependent oxidoreductase [Leifsonia sp. F6_8S_P_1B]|uniref:SDR family NAD(P)-dependent oxidoreductase n=1 Tax=Leifsonia williamsii TaxID=3035919 RepID=A0ABT8K7U2_9MICO|nr:SDR family NAD(P)-dependent oxidoreductase [Leifsonia williamsii]MDN4613526.1 SDR family NAD(P)-dependent oxidoreductase [Leifsonia williamsii]